MINSVLFNLLCVQILLRITLGQCCAQSCFPFRDPTSDVSLRMVGANEGWLSGRNPYWVDMNIGSFFFFFFFFLLFFFFKKNIKKSNRSLFWWIQITPKLLLFIRRSIAYTDWSMDMCVHWLVQFPLQRCNVYILPVFDACSFIDLSSCTYLSDYLLCTHVWKPCKMGMFFLAFLLCPQATMWVVVSWNYINVVSSEEKERSPKTPPFYIYISFELHNLFVVISVAYAPDQYVCLAPYVSIAQLTLRALLFPTGRAWVRTELCVRACVCVCLYIYIYIYSVCVCVCVVCVCVCVEWHYSITFASHPTLDVDTMKDRPAAASRAWSVYVYVLE